MSSQGIQIQLSKHAKMPSCNEILPRLYLGDIHTALNKDELTRLGITDMITVETKQLQPNEIAPCVKRYLYINVMDHTKQDLMSHFEISNEFIESALKVPSNKVYVHCVAGISRSATLVIAYIMKSRCMNYTEAHELVIQKRKIIDPNEGFVKQLCLYHKMKYTIDLTNVEYRRFVLDSLVFHFRLFYLAFYQSKSMHNSIDLSLPLKAATHHIDRGNKGLLFDQFFNKLHLQDVNGYPECYDPKGAYRCNKCRVIVFYPISLIENKTPVSKTILDQLSGPKSAGPASSSWFGGGGGKQSNIDINKANCDFYFIEPQPWMSKMITERDGLLQCYKCKRKLGKFDWTGGENCNCALHNSHLNLNLFKLFKRKIDIGTGNLKTSDN